MHERDGYLPWPRLLTIAYGWLGLSAADFWQLTPGEWMLAVKGWKEKQGCGEVAAALPMDQEELAVMLRQFPDISSNE